MKKLFVMLCILSTPFMAHSARTLQDITLEAGTKTVELGVVNSADEGLRAANFSFNLIRTKNSIKKIKFFYKLQYLEKKCVDYDVKKVMRPEFSQDVCTAIGDGSFQCETKKYDQLYEAKVVCIEKGLVKTFVEKSFSVSFKSAAALASKTKEKFMINVMQPKLKSKKVKVSGSVVESSVQYKVKRNLIGDGVSFKVLH
jgi:hypothetical protein